MLPTYISQVNARFALVLAFFVLILCCICSLVHCHRKYFVKIFFLQIKQKWPGEINSSLWGATCDVWLHNYSINFCHSLFSTRLLEPSIYHIFFSRESFATAHCTRMTGLNLCVRVWLVGFSFIYVFIDGFACENLYEVRLLFLDCFICLLLVCWRAIKTMVCGRHVNCRDVFACGRLFIDTFRFFVSLICSDF